MEHKIAMNFFKLINKIIGSFRCCYSSNHNLIKKAE
jgi:hypothetical protein